MRTRTLYSLNTGVARTDSILLSRGDKIVSLDLAVGALFSAAVAQYLAKIQVAFASVAQFEVNDAANILTTLRVVGNGIATGTEGLGITCPLKFVSFAKPWEVTGSMPLYVHSSGQAGINLYIDVVIGLL